MNKTVIASGLLLACAINIKPLQADNQSDLNLDLSLTPWFASWEQKSTAASRFGTDAIQVNYQIDDAIAYDLELALAYRNWGFSLQSIQQNETVASHDNEVSYTRVGLFASDLFAGVDMDFRHTRGQFSGFIDGTANNGNTGTGTFETDLVLQDFSFLFYRGLGLGVRLIDYELPQDLYLVSKSSPNTVITAGFQEITYSGTFIQLVAMSENLFDVNNNDPFGLTYIVRYGLGKLDPGGQFLADTETLLRNNSTIGSGQSIMDKGDSTFFEVDVSGFKRFNWSGTNFNARLGYRHTRWEAEFGSDSDYQLVTDFETSFSGPYVSMGAEF